MNITTRPYKIDKLTFFRRAFPLTCGNSGKLNTFEVFPSEQHRLNIVETIAELSNGFAHSVGFVLDGIAYQLDSEMRFVPKEQST